MKPAAHTDEADARVARLDGSMAVPVEVFGRRAAKLARLAGLGLPTPEGAALSFDCVRAIGRGAALPPLPFDITPGRLFALRGSPANRAWGGPKALFGFGLSPATAGRRGERAGLEPLRDFVAAYAHLVHGADPLGFAGAEDAAALAARFRALTDADFPLDPAVQIAAAAAAVARAWDTPSARLLRRAKGAPDDGGIALIVQEYLPGAGPGPSGAGRLAPIDARTGAPAVSVSFQGPARANGAAAGRDLEEIAPEAHAALVAAAARIEARLGDVFEIDFVLDGGRLALVDAIPARRNARAAVRVAVDLANRGATTRERALLRVEPISLVEHLHPQIDPAAPRDVFARGLAASPGAATGRMVFTAEAAQAAAAQGEGAILVRPETTPEDIRGMHAARGVLTVHGGMSSHAAVIARGIGLPCVVGASELRVNAEARLLRAPDGREFAEGALITIDGTRGEAMAGAPRTVAPELGGAVRQLLDWADAARRIGVRANADTPAEARMAREFGVDGLGLCRTEHMFFEPARITVMHELIMADDVATRRAALERLLPMQRADFKELFEIMRGMPVTIRLLDPPLHEFLPASPEGLRDLARALGVEVEAVRARAAELAEVNPMLGKRGVRLGITMPEIYEMQTRAILEAAIEVNRGGGDPVIPEIMIPLVSAFREVELVKARIEAIAEAVRAERDAPPTAYRLGVMVETPRAALRSGDLAGATAFLSFGTNDLTQMTYGLSRDDAGRFMRDYVANGVFWEDPFHSLDVEGVGELLLIAANRGRARNPDLILGLCGEHGGDPASIRFCKIAGFDYVSCSPFRAPIARLAAAQASLLSAGEDGEASPA